MRRPPTRALAAVLGSILGLAACVVEQELPDDVREMRSEVKILGVEGGPGGTTLFTFNLRYGLALADEAGLEEVRWTYALVTPQRRVLASNEQRMRPAEPGKTQALVEGDRKRTLEVPAGAFQPGQVYVLWITVTYRGEVLHEVLTAVE